MLRLRFGLARDSVKGLYLGDVDAAAIRARRVEQERIPLDVARAALATVPFSG